MTPRRAAAALAAGLLVALSPPAAAQAPPELDVDLKPETVTVGDRVSAEIALVWAGGEAPGEPRFPAWQEKWGKAEVVAVGEVERFTDQAGRLIVRQTVTLAAFTTGEIALPPVEIAIPGGEETLHLATPEGLAFTVASVLPAPAEGEEAGAPLAPRPAAGLAELAGDRLFPWTAGLLLALVAWSAWRYLARAGAVPGSAAARPLLPPLEDLLDRLRHLDPEAGAEPVHTGLSLAVRAYLGRRLGFPGTESTTSEVRRRLRASRVPPATAHQALGLLAACDEVKFARRTVDARTSGERLVRAQAIGREIEQAVAPPPAEPGAPSIDSAVGAT